MFRQRFGITEHDTDLAAREKIAGALLLLDPSFAEILPALFEFMGVPDPARPAPRIAPEAAQRRLLEAFRRVVKADSRERTVVTLIEDLHWLDEASDRFVAELVEIAPATRSLVLLNFRPEYAAEWTKRSGVHRSPCRHSGRRRYASCSRRRLATIRVSAPCRSGSTCAPAGIPSSPRRSSRR